MDRKPTTLLRIPEPQTKMSEAMRSSGEPEELFMLSGRRPETMNRRFANG
jgi:hypothetical protein